MFEAGRRGRDWGLGILYDSGNAAFARQASVFDGLSCRVNIQKTQNIGFALGYDKLRETGPEGSTTPVGLAASSDDTDQYYFMIEMDERQTNPEGAFSRHIGIYMANIKGKGNSTNNASELYLLDLYVGLYFGKLSFQSELLVRRGKSGDKNTKLLGGAMVGANTNGGEAGQASASKENDVEARGGAVRLSWMLSQSGSNAGPKEYGRGDFRNRRCF